MRDSDPDRPYGLFLRGFLLWNGDDRFAGKSGETPSYSAGDHGDTTDKLNLYDLTTKYE